MTYEQRQEQESEADRIIRKVNKKAKQKYSEVKQHVNDISAGLRAEAMKDAEHTKKHVTELVKKQSTSNRIGLVILGIFALVIIYLVAGQ